MIDLKALSDILQEHIHSQHLPLAIRMAKSADEVPPRLRHPAVTWPCVPERCSSGP
jgi:hypothetical protein